MKSFAVLFSLLLAAQSLAAIAAQPENTKPSVSKTAKQDAAILSEVKSLIAMMTDGIADNEGGDPIITYAPPGGPDPDDAIVLFDMAGWDGGNNSREFLAVFTSTDNSGWSPDWKPHPYHLAALALVGGDMEREFYGERITVDRGGIITIDGVTWGPDDAHCCPKKPMTVKFRYTDFKLTELK